jgi:hypothetical protein
VTKIEITADMVIRAREYMKRVGMCAVGPGGLDKLLDAALNPPPEPEIVVTNEMFESGMRASFDSTNWIVAIYRAMRVLEPQPMQYKARMVVDGGTAHCRKEDRRECQPNHVHCRKDDS